MRRALAPITLFVAPFGFMMSATAKSTDDTTVILKAYYYPAEGSNEEHGQGAVERNELWHRGIERCVWLIQVPWPGSPREWERKLTETVYDRQGSFTAEHASAEERRLVESGAIKLQK